MRVLQVPFAFHPDAMGGTEVYVAALSQALLPHSVESVIAAPDTRNTHYAYNGLDVHRFAIGAPTLPQVYGQGDPIAATHFGAVLETVCPDVVHFHAHTSAISRLAVQEAKKRALKVVFTYHTPTVTCSRGTMMIFGQTPCDGRMEQQRCAACTAHAQGLPRLLSTLLGRVPPKLGSGLAKNHKTGGVWTALQLSFLMDVKHRAAQEIFTASDRIIAVCAWIQEVLRQNQVPPTKVVLNRQGLPYQTEILQQTSQTPKSEMPPIRLLFLGRLDPVKGIETAIEAVRRQAATVSITLDIYGVAQSGSETYRDHLYNLAGNDPRIQFHAPVKPEAVVELMQGYHALLVPSVWLETGPLVVLEAFAAKLPVLGSRLGGIAELVTHGVNGLLIEPNNINAWIAAISRFAQEPSLHHQLTQGIQSPRTVHDVAYEMVELYHEVIAA